ncbi:MAG TPA: ABC transporter ATP-binding protein [Clostridiaceae bacterium]|nr:ABC transporter ATP-binding protein [Clostridiaceae bacterium]
MIRIIDMCKEYRMGDTIVKALDNVSLHIKQHEFVAIVGPSGSGKSTLMNMIGCLDTPTSGTYYLDGKEVSKLSDNQLAEIRSRKIGFIFQSFNLLQKLTALENVELPLVYQGVRAKERHRRAKEALESVGLGERMHHKPTELSGGQQQRVAIARALVSNPPIILADEPTGNLDSKSGEDIMKILKELHGKGNTIVLITHDNNVALQAKRIVRIEDGKILQDRGVD